jgi:hypothetical protein
MFSSEISHAERMGQRFPSPTETGKRYTVGVSPANTMLILGMLGCAGEPAAVTIADPAAHWSTAAFVELVPSVRLPTSLDERDHIRVFLSLPDGARVGSDLRVPPGTVADRVEYDGERAIDVRGTRFTADGERFHVYRPDGEQLAGWEWRRGDKRQQRLATERLSALVERTGPEMAERFRRLNQCPGCHNAGQAAARIVGPGPQRATDGSGLYHLRAVLDSSAPVEHHRPRDLNAADPFIAVRCGDAPARLVENGRARRFECADATPPVGHLDVRAALAAGDAHAEAVCRARAYLSEHMDEVTRAAFAASLAECVEVP